VTEPDEPTQTAKKGHPGGLRWLLLALLPLILTATAAAAFLGMKPYDPGQPPDQIKLSWSGDPHTGIVIVWHADRAEGAGVVVSTATASRTFDAHRTHGDPIGTGVWFQAQVTGLRPGTTYDYVISSGPAKSPAYQFRTEPAGPHAVRFDVFADQGDCVHYAAACKVMDGIARDRPDFVLGAGDLTYSNDNGPDAADTWANDIMRYYSTWAPLLPTPGNHEYLPGDSIGNYRGRFSLPLQQSGRGGLGRSSGDYYSFTYGPVHVVALPERYIDMKAGSQFQQWLDADLRQAAADRTVKWRVAFDHRPFYSTGQRHGADHTYVKWVRPVLEKYHVDLVFSGHEHTYERTLPMLNGVPLSKNPRTWAQGVGTAYVVTGGGGAPIYNDFGPAQPWDAVRRKGHEHLRVDIDAGGRTLRLTAIADDDGHVSFDQFTITAR
jgi:acid phosphatase type 7